MAVLAFATLLSFIIKGMCGFANTIVFNSITSFTANNVNISPIELLVGYPSNFLITWKARKSISMKKCIPMIFFIIIGSIPGAIFLKNGDTRIIKIVLGIVIVGIGIEMLLREKVHKMSKPSKILLAVIGLLTGILCGMFGIGALMAAYMSRTADSNEEFKGSMCLVFCVENTIRVITYICYGIITLSACKTALYLLPVMLCGLLIGMQLSKIVKEDLAKRTVLILLIISGFSLVLQNLY